MNRTAQLASALLLALVLHADATPTQIPNRQLQNSSVTINGHTVSLGDSTSVTAGDLGALTSVPTGNQLWVTANGSDSTGTRGKIDKPYLTISAAISAASSGDLIRVGPGTFTENSGITLPSGVSLVGAGIDVTKITSNLTSAGNTTVLSPGTNSVVADLTITSTGSNGLPFGNASSNTASTNVLVYRIKIVGTADGIYYNKSGVSASFYDSIITASTGTGGTVDTIFWTTGSTDLIELFNCTIINSVSAISTSRGIYNNGGTLRMYGGRVNTTGFAGSTATYGFYNDGTTELYGVRFHTATGSTVEDLHNDSGTLAINGVARDDGAALVATGTITQLSRYALRDNNLSDLPTPATAFDTLTVAGSDVASASTTNIGAATGYYINVTGTTTITAFDNVAAGRLRIVKFGGALTLTHNSTSLILPGAANIMTVAGDTAIFESLGSGNWRCVGYFPTTVSGTGAAIRQTSPTFVTPNIGVATATSVNSSTVPSSETLVGRATTDTLTNKTINSSTNTIGDGNTFSHDLTATPNDTGGWTEYKVSGTDVTYNGQTLQDITGLVSGTLSNSTLYEFEAKLIVTTSADTTGIKYGVHGGGTGAAATVSAIIIGTSSAAGASVGTIGSIDTGSGTLMTGSGVGGEVVIAGHFTTCSTGTATMSLQHLKVTSGTSTVKIGSKLRIRKN